MKSEEILNICKKAENIYLYGAGAYGREMALYLTQNGIRVAAFLVTEKNDMKVTECMGVPVYGIGEYKAENEDKIVLCMSAKYTTDVLGILEEKGIIDYLCMNKEIYEDLDRRVSYSAVRRVPNGKYVQVLTFHRVADKQYDPWQMAVPPSLFEEYIRYLKTHYRILRFEEDWNDVDEKSVVITFDDGYYDFYAEAFPILKKYDCPATLFVCTGNIGTEREFWYDRLTRVVERDELRVIRDRLKRMLPSEREAELQRIEKDSGFTNYDRDKYDRTLTPAEIRELWNSGLITIGAHTVTHSSIGNEPYELQKEEIFHSKNVLESIIGKSVTVFSYPFGQKDTYSDVTIELLKKAGFRKAACTVSELAGADSPIFEVPRIGQAPRDLSVFARDLEKKWFMEGEVFQ